MTQHKPSQKVRLLEYLQRRGDRGATSFEIVRDLKFHRFSARMMELRRDGHLIDTKRMGTSADNAEVFRHTYRGHVDDLEQTELFPGEQSEIARAA